MMIMMMTAMVMMVLVKMVMMVLIKMSIGAATPQAIAVSLDVLLTLLAPLNTSQLASARVFLLPPLPRPLLGLGLQPPTLISSPF